MRSLTKAAQRESGGCERAKGSMKDAGHQCYKPPVLRFVAGFIAASLLWIGLLVGVKQGFINLDLSPPEEVAEPEALAATDAPAADEPKRKRRAKRRTGERGDSRRYEGESSVGDDLGGPEARNLDVANAGGEEQLLGSEIERGFDGAMPSIRRCLILAASDEPVTGKLVFGMRIAGSGRVQKVNLKGPSAITQSEAGSCLTAAARGIQFRSFNGPDMLVNYPLTLQ